MEFLYVGFSLNYENRFINHFPSISWSPFLGIRTFLAVFFFEVFDFDFDFESPIFLLAWVGFLGFLIGCGASFSSSSEVDDADIEPELSLSKSFLPFLTDFWVSNNSSTFSINCYKTMVTCESFSLNPITCFFIRAFLSLRPSTEFSS